LLFTVVEVTRNPPTLTLTMTSTADNQNIQLFAQISAEHGARKALTIPRDASAKALRQEVSRVTCIPLTKLRVIFRGRIVSDDDSKLCVDEYRLEPDSVLHCMGPVESSTTVPVVGSATTTPATTPAAAVAAPPPSAATYTPVVPAVPPLSTATAAAGTTTSPAAAAAVSTPPSSNDPILHSLTVLRDRNTLSIYQTAVETLLKVLTNIADKPLEEKYRKLKRNNAAFSKRLGGVAGGHEAMTAVGFVVTKDDDGTEFYTMEANAEAWPKLMEAKTKVSEAVNQIQQQQRNNIAQPMNPSAGAGSGAGIGMNAFGGGFGGGLGGFGGGNMMNNPAAMMNDPAAQAAMIEMMSNPQTLQAALQV
jgi:PUB domain/Ubiquitin family